MRWLKGRGNGGEGTRHGEQSKLCSENDRDDLEETKARREATRSKERK